MEEIHFSFWLSMGVYGATGDDLLEGGTQNDYLDGGAGGDILRGQDGDDNLYGQDGDDILDGGAGNDFLDGGYGNDTYLFGKGSGADSISAYEGRVDKFDTIHLSTGVTSSDVALQRDGDALVLSITGTSDSLRVSGYFYNDAAYGYQVEQIEFADCTAWDVAAVKAKVLVATAENDTLVGYATADTLIGLAGDDNLSGRDGDDLLDGNAGEDRLYGEGGDDLLQGGAQNDYLDGGAGADTLHGQVGDDTLYGQDGNDILDGGAGNDILSGGYGNDTYLFGRGSGADTVYSYDDAQDIAQFGPGISADQLWFSRSGADLLINTIGSADTLTIANWYYGTNYHLEQFKTSDGRVLLDTQVPNLVDAMASFSPPAAGQTTLPTGYQNNLAPQIAANWH